MPLILFLSGKCDSVHWAPALLSASNAIFKQAKEIHPKHSWKYWSFMRMLNNNERILEFVEENYGLEESSGFYSFDT